MYSKVKRQAWGLPLLKSHKVTYAGVDPYNFYFDRSSADNVLPVG